MTAATGERRVTHSAMSVIQMMARSDVQSTGATSRIAVLVPQDKEKEIVTLWNQGLSLRPDSYKKIPKASNIPD